MFETARDSRVITPNVQATEGARGEVRTEVQNAVRDAVREARDAAREAAREARAAAQEGRGGGPAIAVNPFQPTRAPQEIIDALNAQIAGERATIDRLTNQLTPQTSSAQAEAIADQIEQAQERVSVVQEQLDRALGVNVEQAEAFAPPFDPQIFFPRQAVQLVEMFFVTVVVIAIGLPLARAFARRMDRKGQLALAAAAPNLDPRLDRIEQAIEAIAIEVERASEGQRYTNKLMAELRALPSPNPMEQWPRAAQKEGLPLERPAER